jgi:predicted amino acid racemase
MISDVDQVVAYSDISLNSELETIKALNRAAQKDGKIHQIILMFDLGDLREGVYYTHEFLPLVESVLTLKNIDLVGIGANLTCYGGLVPSREILNRLVKVKESIENQFKHKLKIISGGNSSTVTLFDQSQIPNEINSLRLGESIFFGKETSYSTAIEGFHQDNFILEAEIIECQTKPSYPDGPTSINSFGEKVEIEDKGLMKRAILAIGKQDVILDNLRPIDKRISVIGGSSDHLIIDLAQTNYQLGDIIQFSVNYPGFLHLMNSNYVHKIYQ